MVVVVILLVLAIFVKGTFTINDTEFNFNWFALIALIVFLATYAF